MKSVDYFDYDGGGNLWSEEDGPVPSVGENIVYFNEVLRGHRSEEYEEKSLSREKEMNGSRWEVKKIEHEFRRYEIVGYLVHNVYVFMRRIRS